MPCTLSTQKRTCPDQLEPTMRDWSSLHSDLVRRVGDCFLVADDLDCYMNFRAVCLSWRSAIDNPCKDSKDPRFMPSNWVLLERNDDNSIVTLVNTSTGRLVTKSIPMLMMCRFVGVTSSGLFLLGKRDSPFQAFVLNPFTGSIVHFNAKIPWGGVRTVVMTTSPEMVFITGQTVGHIMWADQKSEQFQSFWADYPDKPTCLTYFAGNVYLINQRGDIMSFVPNDATKGLSAHNISMATTIPSPSRGYPAYYLVKSRGELLHVTRPWYNLPGQQLVHKVNTVTKVLEPVRDISNRALFVSHIRCLSLDANKFPAVKSGCIYFVDPIPRLGAESNNSEPSFMTIHRLNDGAQDRIMFDPGAMEGCSPQFTHAQVVANYCKSIYYADREAEIFFTYESESDEESSGSN